MLSKLIKVEIFIARQINKDTSGLISWTSNLYFTHHVSKDINEHVPDDSNTWKLPLVSKEVKINEENQRDCCSGRIRFVTGCPS